MNLLQIIGLALYVGFLGFFALVGVLAMFASMPWLALGCFGVCYVFNKLLDDELSADDDEDDIPIAEDVE
jgi:uncharacterized membrane protein YedE/YeeE